jgi:hypothetical protein
MKFSLVAQKVLRERSFLRLVSIIVGFTHVLECFPEKFRFSIFPEGFEEDSKQNS